MVEATKFASAWRTRAAGVLCLLAVAVDSPAGATVTEPCPPARKLTIGDALPTLDLRDQHGVEAPIDASTSLMLFTRDMDGGGLVKTALSEDGARTLTAARAVYVSDVSGMPFFVRSMFALPSIRKRAYPVRLDETGAATGCVPYRQGAVTMLTLESGKITAIDFATTIEALKTRLRPSPAP
jgi:hypothetical protein